MNINRNNYEAFLLDLMEGRLSAEEKERLYKFLLKHPDCPGPEADLDLWALEESRITFPAVAVLKKKLPEPTSKLSKSNFDLFSIARLEHDLTTDQEEEHKALVAKDEIKRVEWQGWQKTIRKVVREHLSELSHIIL